MSNTSETALLNLLFKNTAWAGVGDSSGLQPSAAAGNFYIRLHTADPGEAGTGDTNEVSYTGYAPVAVARGSGFTVTGNSVSNAAAVTFGECTGGSGTVTHFSICEGSGAGADIIVSGQLDNSRSIISGITPVFAIGALVGTLD